MARKFVAVEIRNYSNQQDIFAFDTLEEAMAKAQSDLSYLTKREREQAEFSVGDVDESCLCDWYEPEEGEPIDWTCIDSWGKTFCNEIKEK